MRIFTDEELLKKCEEYKSIPFEARAKVLAIPENPAPVLNASNIFGFIPVHAPKNLTILAQSVNRGFGASEKSVLKGYKEVLDRSVGAKKRQDFEIEEVVEQPDMSLKEIENVENAVSMMENMIEVGETDPRVEESLRILKDTLKEDRAGMQSEDLKVNKDTVAYRMKRRRAGVLSED